MEGVSVGVYRGIRRYWRRKRYERLDGGGSRRRGRVEAARMGGRRRGWRIKLTPKIRLFRFALRLPSPKALLLRLRDGYVRMMLSLSNSRVFVAGGASGALGAGFGGQPVGSCRPFGQGPIKEYDEKVLVEIYRSLVARGQLPASHF
ncbi:unnamed protein product [Victoria cruziana]